jgi:hypothetical protein
VEQTIVNSNEIPPSRELYLKVRAAFMLQDSQSLSSWCRENNVSGQNATSALMGSWNGPKGKEVRRKLIEASGVRYISFEPIQHP